MININDYEITYMGKKCTLSKIEEVKAFVNKMLSGYSENK